MLVITGVFWVAAFSVLVYLFTQEVAGLRKATKMKDMQRLGSIGVGGHAQTVGGSRGGVFPSPHQSQQQPQVPAAVSAHMHSAHPDGGGWRRVDVSASTGRGAGRVVSSYD
mmetsp:Transcript_36786/g.59078  ORF Transcript_36786/g.59078 Transcript_36786/m.59078 type:complete len:111 (+) Transcript_36786:179-511(+)